MSALHSALDAEASSHVSFAVVLMRAPMVLCVRASVHMAAARELAASAHDAWMTSVVAALRAALEPWLAPLALTLAFLGRDIK